MAKPNGRDAAEMAPRFIPDYNLLGRDDSGGGDWQPYNAQFGDGGFVTGSKKHLSVSGGDTVPLDGTEQESTIARRNANKPPRAPASAVSEAKD